MHALALLLAAPLVGDLEPTLTRVLPRAIELRRAFHAHPELSNRETQTAARIAEVLREAGLEVREGVAGTGVVAILRGALPGGVVAYRADMDALPIGEQTGLPYASQRTDEWEGETVGVMHACGHDVHMAIAVGVALALAEAPLRESLRGGVAFIFQPAEEGLATTESYGARRMVEEGLLEELRPLRMRFADKPGGEARIADGWDHGQSPPSRSSRFDAARAVTAITHRAAEAGADQSAGRASSNCSAARRA